MSAYCTQQMERAFHALHATSPPAAVSDGGLLSTRVASVSGLPMPDLGWARAQALASVPEMTDLVTRTPGPLTPEASLLQQNSLLHSQLHTARLAQENARLRWQLQQHQHWQAMVMHEQRQKSLAAIGGNAHSNLASTFSHAPPAMAHAQVKPTGALKEQMAGIAPVEHVVPPCLPPGFKAPPGLPPPPGLEAPPGLVRCDSRGSTLDDISTMAPEGLLSREVSEDGYDSDHSDSKSALTKTTCMMRNLPNFYTRERLLLLLDNFGFAGKYNFLYVPMDFNSDVNLGYAFINMMTPEDAVELQNCFQGFTDWVVADNATTFSDCTKVCEVVWSDSLQGLTAHVERYRNSPVMHESVADSSRPLLFVDGQRVPFPAPTKKIRAPRHWIRKH